MRDDEPGFGIDDSAPLEPQPAAPAEPPLPTEPTATPGSYATSDTPSSPGATDWTTVDGATASTTPRRLSPLSVIGRSLDVFIWRPLLFVGIGLVSAIASGVTSLLYGDPSTVANPLLFLLISLIVGAIGLATSLATVVAADDLRANRPTGIARAFGRAVDRLIPAILSYLAVVVALVGLGFIALIPIGLLSLGSPGLAGILVFVLGVFFVWLFLRWSLATPAIALDGRGPLQALSRSAQVLRGSLLRLLATWIMVGLFVGPLSAAIGFLSLTGTDQLLAVALTALLGVVVTPIFGILIATIYGDLTGRPDAGVVKPDVAGRSIIIVGVLVLGIAGVAIAAPKIGSAIDRFALRGVPAQDQGRILTGTAKNPLDPCRPANLTTTFSTSDTIYIGGYFTRTVPRGERGEVTVYLNDQVLNSGSISSPVQPIACYYETDPIVGAPAGTYRIVVTYGGATIAEGTFTIR